MLHNALKETVILDLNGALKMIDQACTRLAGQSSGLWTQLRVLDEQIDELIERIEEGEFN